MWSNPDTLRLCADEKEDICLHEQPMKWLLPPGLSTTGEAPDARPRRGSKRPATPTDSPRARRQPSSRRLGQVTVLSTSFLLTKQH